MFPHLLTTTFLAAGLLLSTLGCSKKQDPSAQSLANIGSYVYNGQVKNCTTKATLDTGNGANLLGIDLTTTPQPATGSETLRLLFQKSAAQPVSAYTLVQIQQVYGGAVFALYNADSFTITSTSGGGFSGTFSSISHYSNPAITPQNFTNGVFTDVRP